MVSISRDDSLRTATPSSLDQIEIESDEEPKPAAMDATDQIEEDTLEVLGPLGLMLCFQLWKCSQG